MPPTIYYSLREGDMSRDHLHNRIEQWWKDSYDHPWVKRRAMLLKRSCPYYTLPEMEELVDVLLHEDERTVLKEGERTQDSRPMRMSQQAYRRYERASLALAKLSHCASYPRPASFLFDSFPDAKEGEDDLPQGEVILAFAYDLRLVQVHEVYYYVIPGDEVIIKVAPSVHPTLVRGRERSLILNQVQGLAPWILTGTSREVQMRVSQQTGME